MQAAMNVTYTWPYFKPIKKIFYTTLASCNYTVIPEK